MMLDNSDEYLDHLEFRTHTIDLFKCDTIKYAIFSGSRHERNSVPYSGLVIESDVRPMILGRMHRLVVLEMTEEEFAQRRSHYLEVVVPMQHSCHVSKIPPRSGSYRQVVFEE